MAHGAPHTAQAVFIPAEVREAAVCPHSPVQRVIRHQAVGRVRLDSAGGLEAVPAVVDGGLFAAGSRRLAAEARGVDFEAPLDRLVPLLQSR